MERNREPLVQILMATYNGEKYLHSQLESILNQTYMNWNLLIRDDGSTDKTIDILKEYSHNDARIQYIVNEGVQHGWQINFQKLIQLGENIEAEFFMFCDQDDVWLHNKIEEYILEMRKLETEDEKVPIVLYSNMAIIDDKGKVINSDFNQTYHMRIKRLTDAFFTQRVYGCSMMFNKVLLDKTAQLLKKDVYEDLSHDGLVVKVSAINNGKIQFLEKPYMQYRRYGNNATGNQEFSISSKRILRRLKDFDKLAHDQASTYRQSLHFIELVIDSNMLSKKEKKVVFDLKTCIQKGGASTVPIWIKYHVDCGNFQRTISHFLVLFSKKHRKYL